MLGTRRVLSVAARAVHPCPIDARASLHAGFRLFSTGQPTLDGAAAAVPSPASQAPVPQVPRAPTEHTLWVQRKGAVSWAMVVTKAAVSVERLTEEIRKKLELRGPLDSITLRVVGKGADGEDKSVPLDSIDTLEQALGKASSQAGLSLDMDKLRIVVDARAAPPPAYWTPVVEGPPTFPPLPPAISPSEVKLGDELFLEAAVPVQCTGVSVTRTAPVFYTREQIDEVRAFIRGQPSEYPRALMLVGTVKAGKSTLLHDVLPGLIAAEHASPNWQPQRPRPVIFKYSFPLGLGAEDAAMDLSRALADFARDINVSFNVEGAPGEALANLPTNLGEFCQRVNDGGGELWLLLDEMQAPFLASATTPSQAAYLVYKFTTVLGECSPSARVVITGSGLFTLLDSFRTARVNAFSLWSALTFVGLGSAPSLEASEGIAARLLETYADAWPRAVRDAITPTKLVDAFVPSAHHDLTSARPALLASALDEITTGSAATGTPADDLLGEAQGALLSKVAAASEQDTLSALTSLGDFERRVLRDVAMGAYTWAELTAIQKSRGRGVLRFKEKGHPREPPTVRRADPSEAFVENHRGFFGMGPPEQFADFIVCFSEKSSTKQGSDVVCLQPPYATLIKSWVRRSGELAVAIGDDGKIHLDKCTPHSWP